MPEPFRATALPLTRPLQTRRSAHPSGPVRRPDSGRSPEDREFAMMQTAYESTGGLSTGDKWADDLRTRFGQPISLAARAIVERSVVHVDWRGEIWLPIFQFERTAPSVRQEAAKIIDELKDVFNNWELALWFAEPNSWLAGRVPANAIAGGSDEVLEAARADRYLARW